MHLILYFITGTIDNIITAFSSKSIPIRATVPGTYNDANHGRQTNSKKMMIHKLYQYHTMPNLKKERNIVDIVTPSSKCITPDITQVDKRDMQTNIVTQLPTQTKISVKYCSNDYKSTNYQNNNRDEAHRYPISMDSQNRNLSSVGLNAVGYRFFASSPMKFPNGKWNDVNKLVINSSVLSPIPITKGTRSNFNKNKKENDRTLSENDLDKIITPHNILFSPPKSTMSNDELFSAIYKSKRKLNIKNNEEVTTLSPQNTIMTHSNMCLDRAGSRHSWSPESTEIMSDITLKNTTNNLSTARRDFKRLLLQQSAKIGPNRLSATEQLKLSRQHQYSRRNQSPISTSMQQHILPLRALSPRATWKFQTPRTDVLSSTIIEDTVAEERAMKPFQQYSLHNASINNKTKAKRQLDLSEITSHSHKKILNKVDMISQGDRESRISYRNRQLRAEFLAGIHLPYTYHDQYKFRARSESPTQLTNANINKIVSRSPSAPTLETAL